MYRAKDFIYVDLNKTGTVTVNSLLPQLGFPSVEFKHHSKPPGDLARKMPVIATIRDPWSYYLSLWSFGLKRNKLSGPYNALTKYAPLSGRGFSLNPVAAGLSVLEYLYYARSEDWERNKADYYTSDDPESFRRWLSILFDRRTSIYISGVYGRSALSSFAGLYTYRYCGLLCEDSPLLHSRKLRSYDALVEWEKAHSYVDAFIQTSNLTTDLIRALVQIGMIEDETAALASVEGQHANASRSSEDHLAEFYTPELVQLVADRDRLLVEKFGYKPPL